MYNDLETSISLLKRGQPPCNEELINEISVGLSFLTDLWQEKYLDEYIAFGGSKIKFITGKTGSGKSHLLELFLWQAKNKKFIPVTFSAKDVWIHDFKEVYVEILKQCNLMSCLKICSEKIIIELGFKPEDVPDGMNFVDYLASIDLMDPITKREIRQQLNKMFMQNPLVDNNFALACSLLTGGILGHPMLEEHNEALLLSWLEGSKEAKIPAVRKLGLSPSKINKYNARHMLRSLTEIVKLSGKNGIVIAVDDLEILVSSGSLENIRYTKMKREDAYESIRELIDDIDTLKNIMILFSFDKKLLEDENAGFKSYQALWMRIQNEIEGEKFNRFTDIVDMDKLATQIYSEKELMQISLKLSEVVNRVDNHAKPIDEIKAQDLLQKTEFNYTSLVRQVNIATIEAEGCK